MRYGAIVMLAAAGSLAGCSIGSDDGPGIAPTGSGTTRSYAADGFSKIALGGSDDVDVRAGTGFSVRAEGPSDELDRLRIARDGETLELVSRDGDVQGDYIGIRPVIETSDLDLTLARRMNELAQ